MKITFGRRFWIVTTAIIVLFTLIFVGKNVLRAIRIKREVVQLEQEADYFKGLDWDTYKEIIAKQANNDGTTNIDMEEYAREKYGMQRPNEDVYQLSE